MGRPSDYTTELANTICERISIGESVRHICRSDPEMPDKSTVFRWLWRHPEFRDQYAQACEIRAEVHAEEMLDIADDGTDDFIERFDKDGENSWWEFRGEHVQRSKLRVDTRKWIASKLIPKRYGDKIHQEISGPGGKQPILNLSFGNDIAED
jgi:hypothetical protein